MTPEERAVIDAAIEWWNISDDRWGGAEGDLAVVVSTLLAARRVEEQGAPDEMLWVERTWRGVRAGDTVRPPGIADAAATLSSVTQDWHVDPVNVNWTEVINEFGEVKRVPMPIPLEYSSTLVYFQGAIKPRVMNPDAPVEILVAFSELDFLNRHGWADRIATITEEG